MYVEENQNLGFGTAPADIKSGLGVNTNGRSSKPSSDIVKDDRNLNIHGKFFRDLSEQDHDFVRPTAGIADGEKTQLISLSIADGDRFDKDVFVKHLRAIVLYCRDHDLTVDYKSQNKLCSAFGLPSQIYGEGRMDIDDTAAAVIELIEKMDSNLAIQDSEVALSEPGLDARTIKASSKSFVERELMADRPSTAQDDAMEEVDD